VFAELDEQVFPDTVGRRQDPSWSDKGSTAENFSIFVQDGDLPGPATFGSFSASWKQKLKLMITNRKKESFILKSVMQSNVC
jgi:hypothetical protein